MGEWTTPEGQPVDRPIHIAPIGDLREHVTSGEPCPCMPRHRDRHLHEGSIVHLSYDGRETGDVCRRVLDMLGLALGGHGHTWSPELREAYEHALALLNMHWPGKPNEPPYRHRGRRGGGSDPRSSD